MSKKISRRTWLKWSAALASLVGLGPTKKLSGTVKDQPPKFDVSQLPLPIVHRDFYYSPRNEIEEYLNGTSRYLCLSGVTVENIALRPKEEKDEA